MRCVFVGTPAFLGRIDGETQCAFWAEEPDEHDFDPGRLITVDLARTPQAAAVKEIRWSEVEVDDCFASPSGTIAGTTLGPRWPELRLAGVVYLTREFRATLPRWLCPPCPPRDLDGRPYEYETSVYWPHLDDLRAGRRYAGHHAEIIDERGTLARVAVFPPGRSAEPYIRPSIMWIDLASPEQCDVGPESLTTIGVGPAPKEGALFLSNGQLSTDDPVR
jgi:hypothetical protein